MNINAFALALALAFTLVFLPFVNKSEDVVGTAVRVTSRGAAVIHCPHGNKTHCGLPGRRVPAGTR